MSATGTSALEKLAIRDLSCAEDFSFWRDRTDLLALPGWRHLRYAVGFAASRRAVERALRLRYEVFNVELGEGLAASRRTEMDEDVFDEQMTHVVLLDQETNLAVGTYRMQTMAHALRHAGVYSGTEYDLTGLEPWFHSATECGRACIAEDHRSMQTLMLLWRGLRAFLDLHGQRWLFGCCSLTSQDPDDGWRAMKTLRAEGGLHPELLLPARPGFSCGPREREFDPAIGKAMPLPKLFRTYMRLGSQVVSEPAIDRAFGTVDFLILMDAANPLLSALEPWRIPGFLRP